MPAHCSSESCSNSSSVPETTKWSYLLNLKWRGTWAENKWAFKSELYSSRVIKTIKSLNCNVCVTNDIFKIRHLCGVLCALFDMCICLYSSVLGLFQCCNTWTCIFFSMCFQVILSGIVGLTTWRRPMLLLVRDMVLVPSTKQWLTALITMLCYI